MNIPNDVVKLCLVELFLWLLLYISFNELWIDTVSIHLVFISVESLSGWTPQNKFIVKPKSAEDYLEESFKTMQYKP